MAAELISIDANLLVAASVEGHPSHALATALMTRLDAQARASPLRIVNLVDQQCETSLSCSWR